MVPYMHAASHKIKITYLTPKWQAEEVRVYGMDLPIEKLSTGGLWKDMLL
jgi:hypothetical protein